MEIKGFSNDASIEEVGYEFEERYECARREPTAVCVYIVTTSDCGFGIREHKCAVNTFCIFSKEQAVKTATEQYIQWKEAKQIELSQFITSMKVLIEFDNKFATTEHRSLSLSN
jgi:hypothetical protein